MLLTPAIAGEITGKYSEKTTGLTSTFTQAFTNYYSAVRTIWKANEAEAYLDRIREILTNLYSNCHTFAKDTSGVVIDATNDFLSRNEQIGEALGNSERYDTVINNFEAVSDIVIEFAKKTYSPDEAIGFEDGQEENFMSITETFLGSILKGVNSYSEIDVSGYLTGKNAQEFSDFITEINGHLETFVTDIQKELNDYLPALTETISKIVSNFASNIETAKTSAAQAVGAN